MRRIARVSAQCAAMALAPAVAHAHLVTTGLGPFYDGLYHFAVSPEDFLPLVALAFLAGLRDPRHARALFYTLPLAWLVGGLWVMFHAPLASPVSSLLTAAVFLVTGGCLAANLNVPIVALVVLGGALGLIRGTNFVDVAAGRANLLVLLGVCTGVTLVCVIAMSVTLPLKRTGPIVAARVYGSWIAALGLFLAGWLVHAGSLVR